MLTLDEVRTTDELAALLGLHAEWCPAGAHLRSADGCSRAACHRARCHDIEHSYRRYSAGSEYGRYVDLTQPIPEGLVPYVDGTITVGQNGAPRLVTGQRWIGERYALAAPLAKWLIMLRVPVDGDARYLGLCDEHWQARIAAAEAEWDEEVQRIRKHEPSIAAQLARDVGDFGALDRLEAIEQAWLSGDAQRYCSLLHLAEGRDWLRVRRLAGGH